MFNNHLVPTHRKIQFWFGPCLPGTYFTAEVLLSGQRQKVFSPCSVNNYTSHNVLNSDSEHGDVHKRNSNVLFTLAHEMFCRMGCVRERGAGYTDLDTQKSVNFAC